MRARPRLHAASALLGASLMCASCAPSAAVRAARAGDLGRLRTSIADARAHGKLDRGAARELAVEVASHELATSRGKAVEDRIDEVRSCARPLDDALEALAKGSDDASAAATLALLDVGIGNEDKLARKYGGSASPAWRAVGARAAVAEPWGTLRRRLVVDADERVRKGALVAAAAAGDPADEATVLEAARLDPNPLVRSLAVRAAGAIGGEVVVLALRDRWPAADEPLRQSIADAWGMPKAAPDGGLRELVTVAETERGAPAIEAGAVLVRLGREGAPAGLAALGRGIREGLVRDRLLAIGAAPSSSPELHEALAKASEDADGAVRAAALGRLAELPADRAKALAALESLAREGSEAAVQALVRAGDPVAVEGLAKRTASGVPADRLSGARGLVSLGDLGRAAELLADPDAGVRTGVACAILSATERR